MKRIPNPMLARGRRTGIAPANLQAHLDSASNAAQKGQAQFYTPLEWGNVLAVPLANYRHTIVDLNCGTGQLLAGTAAPCTQRLLGCDIEEVRNPELEWSAAIQDQRVTADVTQFYPLLHEVGFEADVFALNPMWDLHLYRERLALLAQSDCPAVALAFAAHDGRTSKDTIDSTVAMLCLALDRCSVFGEGVLIANNATLERLLFAPGAPHAALASHVWARLVIEGNICQTRNGERGAGNNSALRTPHSEFQTGVLYFARGHARGVKDEQSFNHTANLLDVRRHCEDLQDQRRLLRDGIGPRNHLYTEDVAELWAAAREEWNTRHNARAARNPWNIWLDHDGRLRTNLSVFDERANAVKKQEAAQLHQLNGRHPMALVLQKNDRKLLTRVAFGESGRGDSPWRVAPAVVQAVQQSLVDYDAVRAPLKPLNKIQRLGFLDDADEILCAKDLYAETLNLEPRTAEPSNSSKFKVQSSAVQRFPVFRAGQRYAIRTETLAYKRTGEKMNLMGELDRVQWEGAELAIYIGDGPSLAGAGEGGRRPGEGCAAGEHLFMDARLREADVVLSIEDEKEIAKTGVRNCPIEFTLQELIEHFEIPEVPNVATRNPEGYQHKLDLLAEIEQIVNA